MNPIMLLILFDSSKPSADVMEVSPGKLALGVAYGFVVITAIMLGDVIYTVVQKGLWPFN